MPTGYTSGVQDGKVTTLKDYACIVARGFGFLISMRDDPWDAPIPDALPLDTSFYDKCLVEKQEELEKLIAMTPDDIIKAEEADWNEYLKENEEYKAKKLVYRERYEAMIAKVEAWQPGDLLSKMKSFMLEQLHKSIEWDCNPPYERDRDISPEIWYKRQVESVTWSVENYKKSKEDEIKRVTQNNAYLAEFWHSLKQM